MARKQTLTELGIKSALKRLKPGQRIEIMDKEVAGFGIRNRTYILAANFQRGGDTTRRSLGRVGALSLEDAREKAQQWKAALRAGKDPAQEEERQKHAEALQRRITFEGAAEDFIAEKLPSERKGKEVAQDIRRDLIPVWQGKPVSEIGRRDVVDVIRKKKRTAPAQARNLLGTCKRLFSWIVAQEAYGLSASPCSEIKARDIIGEKATTDRVLSDDEIFALWRATGHLPFPYQEIYRLLILNALRLNEVADAAWPEFNFQNRDWTIPKERMKGKNSKARPHLVPLGSASLEIIGSLPSLNQGPYMFSANFGKSPVWVNDKWKKRIDARMLRTLKALARRNGQDPKQIDLPHWTNHDIRRTVRTNLSRLRDGRGHKFPDEVKEAVIAHVKTGIKGVYDKYEFADEKFDALDAWEQHLRVLTHRKLEQPESKIIPLFSAR